MPYKKVEPNRRFHGFVHTQEMLAFYVSLCRYITLLLFSFDLLSYNRGFVLLLCRNLSETLGLVYNCLGPFDDL